MPHTGKPGGCGRSPLVILLILWRLRWGWVGRSQFWCQPGLLRPYVNWKDTHCIKPSTDDLSERTWSFPASLSEGWFAPVLGSLLIHSGLVCCCLVWFSLSLNSDSLLPWRTYYCTMHMTHLQFRTIKQKSQFFFPVKGQRNTSQLYGLISVSIATVWRSHLQMSPAKMAQRAKAFIYKADDVSEVDFWNPLGRKRQDWFHKVVLWSPHMQSHMSFSPVPMCAHLTLMCTQRP